MRRALHRSITLASTLALTSLGALGTALADSDEGSEVADASPVDVQKRVLGRLSHDANVLINLDASELPSTTDMVALGRPATPAIINGLANSMSEAVRLACASVLTSTRDPAALDALMDALDDPDDSVRRLAIEALGQVESRKATPRLLEIIAKPRASEYLKNQAASALGRLGDPKAVKPLLAAFEKTWSPAYQAALWDLRQHLSEGQLSKVVLGPLEEDASEISTAVLGFSIEAAGDLELRDAAKPLRELYESQEGLQNRIIYNLGRIGDKSSAKFLRSLVDRTAEARLLNNVAFALQRLGEDVAPVLRDGLADRRAYIRFNAAFVAGDLKEKALVPDLTRALTDPNDYVRSEVAVALGKIAAPESAAALEQASKEKNPVVRRDALLALATLDYPKYRERVLDELVASPQTSIQQRAVQFLAERNDPTVVTAVLARLDPTDYTEVQVGLNLLDRLWRVDNPDATAFLLRVAAGQPGRHDAMRLLARNVDERARFILKQWLARPDQEQDQLMRAMGRFGDRDTVKYAQGWLQGEDPTSRLYASFQLAAVGQQEGSTRLVAAVSESPIHLKRVAAQRLTELPLDKMTATADAVAKMLDHSDVYVRIYAARALLEQGDPRAESGLWKELGKHIPFITDEVLDIVERAPARVREKFLPEWIAKADDHLKRDLETIRARADGTGDAE